MGRANRPGDPTERVVVYLTPAERVALEQVAAGWGMARSSAIRVILASYVGRWRHRRRRATWARALPQPEGMALAALATVLGLRIPRTWRPPGLAGHRPPGLAVAAGVADQVHAGDEARADG